MIQIFDSSTKVLEGASELLVVLWQKLSESGLSSVTFIPIGCSIVRTPYKHLYQKFIYLLSFVVRTFRINIFGLLFVTVLQQYLGDFRDVLVSSEEILWCGLATC